MPTLSVASVLFFGTLVVFFLWLDLYRHRSGRPISVGNALGWSLVWMSLALSFAVFLGYTYGADRAWLFLAGYVLEQSLSVDNLFVFIAIFSSFALREALQHRILYYGILGAIVLRFVFIGLGTSLLLAGELHETLHMAVYCAFGLIVLFSGYQMYRALGGGDGERVDYADHWSVRWTRRFVPVHPLLEDQSFFTRQDKRWKVTPLFLCLVVVEASDIAFAFDSVPAVIAVTREPFLIYTSNVFAILGLRSLYFLLSAARRYLRHLEKAVIAILTFIGLKLLAEAFRAPLAHVLGSHFEISAGVSLAVVIGSLAAGVVASLLFPGHTPSDRET